MWDNKRRPPVSIQGNSTAEPIYEWQGRYPSDAFQIVYYRDPRQYPLWCCAPDIVETGFLWFVSTDEILAFIAEAGPHFHLETKPEDMHAMGDQLRRIRAEWRAGTIGSIRELVNTLNAHLPVAWIGTFDELCAGQCQVAADVIGAFLRLYDPSARTRRVPKEKISDFIAFLQDG